MYVWSNSKTYKHNGWKRLRIIAIRSIYLITCWLFGLGSRNYALAYVWGYIVRTLALFEKKKRSLHDNWQIIIIVLMVAIRCDKHSSHYRLLFRLHFFLAIINPYYKVIDSFFIVYKNKRNMVIGENIGCSGFPYETKSQLLDSFARYLSCDPCHYLGPIFF